MFLLTLLMSSSAWAAWPGTTDWVPLEASGAAITDTAGDAVGGDEAVDLVGTTTVPTGYWSSDGTTMYFRVRLNETPELGTGSFLQDNAVGIAFDTDGTLSTFEKMVAVDQLTGVLTLRENSSGGTGPSALSTEVHQVSVTGVDDGLVRVSNAGSTIDGDADFFFDFQVSISDLKTHLGLTDATTFRLAMLTGTDGADEMDADMAGAGNLTDLSVGWTDVLSIDRDADGLTDPEEAMLGTDPADADSDDDGLSDGFEAASTIDPLVCDTDGDELPDGLELGVQTADLTSYTDLGAACFLPDTDNTSTTDPDDFDTDGGGVRDGDEDRNKDGAVGMWEIDPLNRADDVDTDRDGIWDALEAKCTEDGGNIDDVDSDGDLISDSDEWLTDTDGDGLPDFCDTDSDGDGIDDSVEGDGDSDGDGTPNYRDLDTDGDGKPDADEGVGDDDGDGLPNFDDSDDNDGPDGDVDGDGISNVDENTCGSNPTDKDTDGDGIDDNLEYPCDKDSDCDGTIDVLDAVDDDLCDTDDTDDTGGTDDTDDTGTNPSGGYTGGSCSSVGGSPALSFGLFGLGGLALALRRRRRAAVAAAATVATVGTLSLSATDALAQDADTQVDAQRFRPARDPGRMFMVDDTVVGDAWTATGAVLFNYADDPLVYRYSDSNLAERALLSHVGTADLVGSFNLPGVRVGLNVPLHLTSAGEGVEGARLLGDMRLSAGAELLKRPASGGGSIGVEGRVDLPTGRGKARLGSQRTTVGAGLMAAYEAGPVLFAGNVGLGTGTGAAFPGDVKLGPNLDYGVGAALDLVPSVGASLEVAGARYLSRQDGAVGAGPTEILGGLRWRPTDDVVISGGAGTGLSKGIGNPDWRVIFGVGFSPRAQKPVRVALADDRDGDGIPDDRDLCPDQPEDFNGIADGDGCPDGDLTLTRVKVLDGAGNQIAEAVVQLLSGPSTGSYMTPDGELVRSLDPGKYDIQVQANGYMTRSLKLSVPKDREHEQVVRLEKLIDKGALVVTARNAEGLPVPASVRVLGENGKRIPGEPDGVVETTLPPGSYTLILSADGYGNVEKAVTIEQKGTASIEVVMPAGKVKIEGDRILILDKVYFELNSAQIKQDSFGLLDEVAATMLNHPELELLEVQGHTDQQGSASYNQGLSERRSASVRTYMISQGVKGDRLQSKGYGEAEPLINETNPAAYAANRRVEFHILKRSATK